MSSNPGVAVSIDGLYTELSSHFSKDFCCTMQRLLQKIGKNHCGIFFSKNEFASFLTEILLTLGAPTPMDNELVKLSHRLFQKFDRNKKDNNRWYRPARTIGEIDLHELCRMLKQPEVLPLVPVRFRSSLTDDGKSPPLLGEEIVRCLWSDGLWREGHVRTAWEADPERLPGCVPVVFPPRRDVLYIAVTCLHALVGPPTLDHGLHKDEPYSATYTGKQWQRMPCDEKCSEVFRRVNEDRQAKPCPTVLRQLDVLTENIESIFESAADDLSGQNVNQVEKRPRLSHFTGVIAKVRWIDRGEHPYTGILKGGCDHALIRFSLARTWDPVRDGDDAAIYPSVAMKFFRDNTKSANLLCMYSILGQAEFNFFEHDLSNHLPALDVQKSADPWMKTMEKASSWPFMLGCSDLCSHDQRGLPVPGHKHPVFPFRIVLHPTNEMHSKWRNIGPPEDEAYLVPLLGSLPPNTHVFEVYAQATPHTVSLQHIGDVVLLTQPTASVWGDTDMFFQHTRMEDDLAMRPDWVQEVNRIRDEQAKGSLRPSPDLPWGE